MSTRDEISAKIDSLKGQISGYNSDIAELKEAKNYIFSYAQSTTDVSDSLKAYDVTRDLQWTGDLNRKMADQRDCVFDAMTMFLDDTESFMLDIDMAVSKLEGMIKDCSDRIRDLESELESLDTVVTKA